MWVNLKSICGAKKTETKVYILPDYNYIKFMNLYNSSVVIEYFPRVCEGLFKGNGI